MNDLSYLGLPYSISIVSLNLRKQGHAFKEVLFSLQDVWTGKFCCCFLLSAVILSSSYNTEYIDPRHFLLDY